MRLRKYIEDHATNADLEADLKAYDRMVDIAVEYPEMQADIERYKREMSEMTAQLRNLNDCVYVLSEERDALKRAIAIMEKHSDADYYQSKIDFYQKKLADLESK